MTDTVENIPTTLDRLTIPITQLTPRKGNPRRGNIDVIAESLQRNGQYRPIVVNKPTSEVLAGNHTLAAAKQLGWQRIAVTFVDVDDDQAARIVLADNRTADLGTYDDAALYRMLQALDDDFTGTGYEYDDLARLEALNMLDPDGGDGIDGDPDDVLEPPAAPITKPGDVWLLGRHRVMCGDSRNPADVRKVICGRAVNIAFTSPPYASQREYDESSGFTPIHPDTYIDWFDDVQANVREVMAADGSWFVNIKEHCDKGQRHLYVKDLVIAHVRRWQWLFVDEFCWVDTLDGVPGAWPNRFKDAWEPVFHFATQTEIKFNALANGRHSDRTFSYSPSNSKSASGSGLLGTRKLTTTDPGIARPSNVLHISSSAERGLGHPAPFPVDLPGWFIRAYSDAGDVVFDPFMGAGSTLLAADREGRDACGTEISPAYVDIICRRYQLSALTAPVLEATGEPHDFTAGVSC